MRPPRQTAPWAAPSRWPTGSGPAGDALRGAADAAFVTGMADAALVAAAVVLAGAVIAAVWLPARAKQPAEPVPDSPAAQPAGA